MNTILLIRLELEHTIYNNRNVNHWAFVPICFVSKTPEISILCYNITITNQEKETQV